MRSPPRVAIVGSLNIDYIALVDRLPAAGQTVSASKLIRRFGGKGANQAVAAARQGAKVSLVGCLGDDDEGRAYRKRLSREGIDVSGISHTSKALTGTALIAVDRNGENTIIVAPGANGELDPRKLAAAYPPPPNPDVVLLQFEIPMLTIRNAVRWANLNGVPVVLNPSPLRAGFPWGKCSLDTLIVNAGEAEAIFGLSPERQTSRLHVWRKALATRKIDHLIITRGKQPTLCLSATEFLEVPTLRVKPVDTVGAGDAFTGTFAAYRARGLDLLSVVRLANCAGALTTLKPGAQEAIPTSGSTQRALRRLS